MTTPLELGLDLPGSTDSAEGGAAEPGSHAGVSHSLSKRYPRACTLPRPVGVDPDPRRAGSRREPPLGQVGTWVGRGPPRPGVARLWEPSGEEEGVREGEKQNKGEKKIRA